MKNNWVDGSRFKCKDSKFNLKINSKDNNELKQDKKIDNDDEDNYDEIDISAKYLSIVNDYGNEVNVETQFKLFI